MSSTSKPATSSATSEFYYACRNGLTGAVLEQLPKMTLIEIDQVQANGSTALHAASFYGHAEIVKLLLEKGASRSIRNRHQCLPCDEAGTPEMKALFVRASSDRFVNDELDPVAWIKYDATADALTKNYRLRQTGFRWTSKSIEHLLTHIKADMSDSKQERILTFLNEAQTDPMRLLQAYTVESNFYRNLNRDVATMHVDQSTNVGLTYFIDFFYKYPALESLSYVGRVYRGMIISQDNLSEYSAGRKVLSKSFLSTSTNRSVAEGFIKRETSNRAAQRGSDIQMCALCILEITNRRTGLGIDIVSEYQDEKEVLVGPCTAFLITGVRRISSNYAEIDLRECEAVNENDDDDDYDD